MKMAVMAMAFFAHSLLVLLSAHNAHALDQKEILNWQSVPAVPYIYWCAPTAKAMIFGFWDSAYPQMGYGRLVCYWYTHPDFGVNIPTFVDFMIDSNTRTWHKGRGSSSGLVNAVNRLFGYAFQIVEARSNAANNWNWELFKREIDQNRPVLWAFNINGDVNNRHSVVGIGYRQLPGRNVVIVLDSNGPDNIAQRRKEYDHYLGYALECYIPGGGTTGSNLMLQMPVGGESIRNQQYNQIVWYVWGALITAIDIVCSVDGGLSWFPIASRIPVHQGQNSFTWIPTYASHRARIYVAGYSSNGTFIAGDGSRYNFAFISQ